MSIYQYLELESLLFILKPVAFLVEVFLGVPFVYYPGMGFINEAYRVNIGKDCAGINFFITMFLMLAFTFGRKIQNRTKKIILIIEFLLFSYVITIIANASRIISSIYVMNIPIISDSRYKALMHQTTGVVIYFVYLLIAYLLCRQVFNKMGDKNEQNI